MHGSEDRKRFLKKVQKHVQAVVQRFCTGQARERDHEGLVQNVYRNLYMEFTQVKDGSRIFNNLYKTCSRHFIDLYMEFTQVKGESRKMPCTNCPSRLALYNIKTCVRGMPNLYKTLYWGPLVQTGGFQNWRNFMSAVVAFFATFSGD